MEAIKKPDHVAPLQEFDLDLDHQQILRASELSTFCKVLFSSNDSTLPTIPIYYPFLNKSKWMGQQQFGYNSFIAAIKFLFHDDISLLKEINYEQAVALADYLQAPAIQIFSLKDSFHSRKIVSKLRTVMNFDWPEVISGVTKIQAILLILGFIKQLINYSNEEQLALLSTENFPNYDLLNQTIIEITQRHDHLLNKYKFYNGFSDEPDYLCCICECQMNFQEIYLAGKNKTAGLTRCCKEIGHLICLDGVTKPQNYIPPPNGQTLYCPSCLSWSNPFDYVYNG